MTTYNTGNPLGSGAAKDLYDNAQNMDHRENDRINEVWDDRFGVPRLTWHGIEKQNERAIAQYGWILVDSFQEGADITLPNQALRDDVTGEYYRWDSALPKTVPAGSTPATAGGVGAGAWIGIGDASLRKYLFSSVIDYVTPEMFGGVSYDRRTIFGSDKNSAADIAAAVAAGTIVDSTSAIQQAVDSGKPVVFRTGVYYTSKPIEQQYYSSGDIIGHDVEQTAICKYTSTPDVIYGVDAVWILGDNAGATGGNYMRYKRFTGMSLARAKLLTNDGSLQQPKAVENYFDYQDVNLVPYGYGFYGPRMDHFVISDVKLHGNETNFYTKDMWMSRLFNVWTTGGTGFVIETGTSYTLQQCWSVQASWNTYNLSGNLIKKYYCYDLGGVYTDLASVACDYAGADGRPAETLYNFRQGAIMDVSSLGAEQCHARRIIATTAGTSAFSTSFIDIDSVSVDMFYNKYGDTSLVAKRRVLIDVADYCSLAINSGRVRSAYADTTVAPNKPHIGYVGKKARLIIGPLYFMIDTIKGVQLNDVSYFTTTNFTTGSISPATVTASEVWVDSDNFQSSAFEIRNGILDIQVTNSASDFLWDAGNNPIKGILAYRFGGYCAMAPVNGNPQFRVQNSNRAGSFIASGTSVGLYDDTVNQWILKQDQGAGGSQLNLGSKLNAQDVAFNFQSAGNGAAFNSRILARTTSGVHSLYISAAQLSPFTDNNIQSGGPSNRWSVVYAGSGTINTSNELLKSKLITIEDSEKNAALEIKKSIRKFKFLDAINSKGVDAARWHFGVGAQTVGSIMHKHGLDPVNYAFWCYDQWDAEPARYRTWDDIYDENGNLITSAGKELISEAKEAGETYGIRYDELSMFILYAI